jgi:hypothetical protein
MFVVIRKMFEGFKNSLKWLLMRSF